MQELCLHSNGIWAHNAEGTPAGITIIVVNHHSEAGDNRYRDKGSRAEIGRLLKSAASKIYVFVTSIS